MSYNAEHAECRHAKEALAPWLGTYGPASEVEAAEERVRKATWALAEAVDETERRSR